ncbi:BAHD family acyltransferase [Selaginella moellendorffii]|uniref:BAHD family acyltransferase n=1 Tax=Selaginella moellendorffii TaxID=88036 RepID=D8S5Y1_SELML|nr:shikimate O-hydroxycinnamoyltransferase [Selaginella moellendorffii]EFJ20252.1 BAHD family acyltransferase [Selaginella moellendorffii]|eukprot:XP_002978805.1 shikimate O-hydroxycinnamoyltransferase [Selaginella moellendorffii]
MGVVSMLLVSTVTPATPTLPMNRIHKLSNLDLHVSFDYYTKQVYYFPPPAPIDDPQHEKPIEEIASSLKASLSQTLVLFNVFAGRVRENGPRLEIECNDRGVPFLVATADASFSDWGDLARCSIEHELNPGETYITNPVDSPLLKFQLTRFNCGGIALGVVTAELIVDGSSYFEFMRCWSQIHKGSSPRDLTPPVFDSSLLKAREPPQITIPVRDYTSSPKPSTDAMGKSSQEHNASAKPTLVKLFEMDPPQVDSLIREIQSGPFGFDTPSSFEATCAMIWKAMTEARGLPDSTLTTYVYAISLKAKNRWNPPIPAAYIGNSAHSPCLSASAGEIKSNHVSYVARLFRQDIRTTTPEHIQSAIDWMELEIIRGRKINFNCDFVGGTGVYSTSLHTFPVYGVDLGMGRPVHYSLVMQPWYGNGVAIVLPTPKGGRSRRLLVSLPREEMRKLCENELFQKFTTAVL